MQTYIQSSQYILGGKVPSWEGVGPQDYPKELMSILVYSQGKTAAVVYMYMWVYL